MPQDPRARGGQASASSSAGEASAPRARTRRLRRVVKRPDHLRLADEAKAAAVEAEKETVFSWLRKAYERGGGSLSPNEKRLALASVFFSALAIVSFTTVKWEVEERVSALPKDVQQKWRDGTFDAAVDGGADATSDATSASRT